MKKLLYFVSAGMLVASAACSNANKQEENDSMADSIVATDSLTSDSSVVAADTVQTAEPVAADTVAAPDNTAKTEEKAAEEAKPSKNSAQIDKLLKQCNNCISDIKREGYENGKPMDPADLQFSDVKSYIKDLRGAVSKLNGLKNDMSDEQKTQFDDIQQKANKIFKEIDL